MQRNSFIEQFELIAEQRGEALALLAENESLSYNALNQWANRIAHALLAAGAGGATGAPVGLLMEPSAAYVAGLLGIAKTAGVFLPLPVDLPPQRLRAFLETARPALVLTDAGHIAAIGSWQLPAINVNALAPANLQLPTEHGSNPGIPLAPTAPAYVMFTSGSTGAPKAILGQQRGLSHFLRWELATFGIGAECRGSWLAPINFDVSLRDMLIPLLAGGTLCIPPPEVRLTPHLLADWLINQHITLVHCVPTVLRLLTQALEDRATNEAREMVPALRHLLVAGEPLYGADVAAWRAVAGTTATVVNLYGPSETTLAKLFYPINALPDDLTQMLPLGQPLPHTEALVLTHGATCAVGEIGEIYLKTPYRSLGYLNDPLATAAVFVANPLTGDASDILYRTGDLGRLRADGLLEYVGRKDGQFKINGVRMDVSEIEAALRQWRELREVAVTVEAGAEHQAVVIAYVTRRDATVAPLDLEAVSAALADSLPPAMHPHHMVVLANLPKTITGKLNRRALPPLDRLLHNAADYVAPADDLETQIAAIWQQVLGLPQVSATRRFQSYGGDSLKAIKVVAEIYRTFHVDVPLRDFFADPTVRGLATWLAQNQQLPPLPSTLPLSSATNENYPATPAQTRLWSLYRMGIAPAAYNLAEAFVITGDLDVEALAAALQILVHRHEALRTTFAERDGHVHQMIHHALPVTLEQGDLRRAPQPLAAATALFAANRDHAFDLERGPLLRLALYRLPDADSQASFLFLFNIHHIISDVQSLAILMQELALVYDAQRQGLVAHLPPLTAHYRDFVAWVANLVAIDGQRGRQNLALNSQHDYWLEIFATLPPPLNLPTDRPRPPVQTFVGSTRRTLLDAALMQSVERLARDAGTTRFAVLTTVVLVHLHRLTGQTDLVIGTPVLGRERPEFARLVGYCINSVGIRAELNAAAPFAAVLQRVAAAVEGAMVNASYPFDALLAELPLERDMSRGALFDVMVVEQAVEGLEFELPGVDSRIFGNEEDAWAFSRFDLVFHFQATADGLALDINFNTDLFDAERIDRYGQQLTTLARAASATPTAAVGQLALLPAAERDLIDRFATGASAERSPAATIISLITEVAARAPAHVALVDGQRSVSYADMLAAAERLAAHLSAAGIQRGDRVAVIATRSIESVIALLGILNAGAVYVPIDADYPAARIAALIAQVKCRLVLVESATQIAALPGEHAPVTVLEPFLNPSTLPLLKEGAEEICAPNDVAYIIFTSGSTGQPKAVEIEHQSFINTALGMIAKMELGATDRTLQFASPSFDAALINVSLALFAGGTLVLPPRAVIDVLPDFLAFMHQTAVTCIILPPTYLRLLKHTPLPGVRVLMTAGEAAPVADLSHYAQTLRTFNAYGPTEASVCVSVHRISAADAARVRLPIGSPLPNTTLHILDAALNPQPLGVPGEIFIGGAGVARGYAAAPALTAERFIQHPMSGARLYRTGDLGCWLTDGSIDFLGRTDHQVKISGHRIELAEVEQALRGVAGIADAHVTTLAHGNGNQALVGYYVAETRLQLWPSVAEFFVYDHVAYSSMARDEARNQRYRAAFARHLPGKTVVDIGTGPFAILAQLALAAGARKVYAVDLLEETAQQARETVARLGLAERIEVIHGNALELVLPEPVDVCISEIVGAIGGAEGAAKIINGVRHLLKNPTHMLPQRSLTRIAAVSLPDGCFEYAFLDIAAHYVEKIFAEVGRPFDLRLCVKNLSREHLISTDGTFEDLDYTRDIPLETAHQVTLTVTTDSVLTGLVVWLDLFVDAEHHVDILDHPGSWLPVLLPVFPDGVAVTAGEQLAFTVERRLHRNGLNPDFILSGTLARRDGTTEAFTYRSDHISADFRDSPFYARLFPAHGVRRSDPLTPLTIRRHLSHMLPSYEIPAYLLAVEALPLTASGKVDRAALPAPQLALVAAAAPPETVLEQQILRVWQTALERSDIGIDDDFFALGGDSIRAIQIASALRSQGITAEVKDIFTAPRVRDLAAQLAVTERPMLATVPAVPTVAVPLLPIQHWFFAAVTVDRHHFNQAVELCWVGAFGADAAAAAVMALWQHHEQLRVIFPEPAADGQHMQQLAAAGSAPAVLRLPAAAPAEAYLAAATRLHCSFNLATGPLFGAVLWDNGATDGRVLLVAHHLVVDAVSWLILIEDFAQAYEAALTGTPLLLPAPTAAYLAVAQIQIPPAPPVLKGGESAQPSCAQEKPRLEQEGAEAFQPPITLDGQLAADALALLIETVVPERGISLEALLLGALAQAWAVIAERPLVAMVERHGRDQVPAGLDVSRTVGWFTLVIPLTLDGRDGAYTAAADAARALQATPPTTPAQITADVVFNHLGTLTTTTAGAFTVNWDAPGAAISPALRLEPGLEILTALEHGALSISVTSRAAERGARVLAAFQAALAQIAAEGGIEAGGRYDPNVDLDRLIDAD